VPTFSAHCTPVSKPSVNFISFHGAPAPLPRAWHGEILHSVQKSALATRRPGGRHRCLPGATAARPGPGLRRQVPGRGDSREASTGPRSRRPGRRQLAQARGDDAIRVASPGRRRRRATAIVSTLTAASAGSCVMPLRTLPRVLSCSNEQAHAQNLNAMARFHCSHPASLRNDELEIIAWKSSLALSLPSFLPPSLSLSKTRPRASRGAQNPAR